MSKAKVLTVVMSCNDWVKLSVNVSIGVSETISIMLLLWQIVTTKFWIRTMTIVSRSAGNFLFWFSCTFVVAHCLLLLELED